MSAQNASALRRLSAELTQTPEPLEVQPLAGPDRVLRPFCEKERFCQRVPQRWTLTSVMRADRVGRACAEPPPVRCHRSEGFMEVIDHKRQP